MGAIVYSVERQRELYLSAKALLHELNYNIRLFYCDCYEGLPTYAPFDKILVTAASPVVPEKLKHQMKTGGRLVVPLGGKGTQVMTTVDRISDSEYEISEHGYFSFVPLLKGTVK